MSGFVFCCNIAAVVSRREREGRGLETSLCLGDTDHLRSASCTLRSARPVSVSISFCFSTRAGRKQGSKSQFRHRLLEAEVENELHATLNGSSAQVFGC